MKNGIGSSFYKFSVVLWDYLIGNALFLLFNITIPISFFFLKANTPLALILLYVIASLNVIPSFIALKYTYTRKECFPDQSILKLFWKGYKLSFKESMKASVFFLALLALFFVDIMYFRQKSMPLVSAAFLLAAFVTFYFIISYSIIQSDFNFKLKDTLRLSVMYIMKLIKPAITTIAVFTVFIFIFYMGFHLTIWVMFAVGAKVNNYYSRVVVDEIYRFHTDEGIAENEDK